MSEPVASPGESVVTESGSPVETQLVFLHSLAALLAVLIAVVFGILISLQFFIPDFGGSWLSMAWGRMRYAHTQGIMIGWLGNAFLAFLYHAVPVLAGRPITSVRLGRWLFGLWNLIVVLPGWLLVLAGISQPIEWAEFPPIVDAFLIVALVMAAIQFIPPFFARGLEELYVSSWYIIGALVFTLLAYPMGNIVPELVPGAESAAFTGLWIHDAVGLFVTPLALAILYFVIPAATGRPLFSHFLSMLGFWGLFFLYPLNGTHHYVFSVIPMSAQLGAIAASALLGVIVIIVVTNLLLSARGARWLLGDTALRFAIMSTLFYLVVSVQGALQAQMSLNRVIHFSDWVIGHSHLAMLGFATFAGIAGIIHAWQRMPWARYNASALNWSFWLLTAGVSIMFIDLTLAGLVESRLWLAGAPWMESVVQAKPYWLGRTLSAIPITAGFLLLFYGLLTGPKGAGVQALSAGKEQGNGVTRSSTASTARAPGFALRMTYRVSATAAIVFFCLSVFLLGVLPGRALDEQISAMTPENVFGLSAAELRGREIYAREGCAYCHTQQIRYTDADMARFGAPTLAWEGQFDTPHMWGTRRVGPDLSRSHGTRSEDWQFTHLFSPRSVVPWSVMPSYAVYFDGAPDKPKQEARDLVAYLETLGRARELAWPEGDAMSRSFTSDDRWAQMSLNSQVLNAHTGKAEARDDIPVLSSAGNLENGMLLWQDHCAGCHGANGVGYGPAAAWLEPLPADLSQHEYSLAGLAATLWQGVEGTAMPAWRDLSVAQLSDLAAVVRSFHVPEPEVTVTGAQRGLGETVYRDNCTQCHGDNGDGQGFAAAELQVAPTDFTNQRPSVGASMSVLQNGVKGTPMAPWTDRLNSDEMLAVSHYLRQLFGDSP